MNQKFYVILIGVLHTGWTDPEMQRGPQKWGSQEPDISKATAKYLAAKNILAVGADTWGVAAIPPETKGDIFATHIVLLLHNGIYLLETINTGPLVRDNAYEFFFVLGLPRIEGAVQAMIDPIAIY